MRVENLSSDNIPTGTQDFVVKQTGPVGPRYVYARPSHTTQAFSDGYTPNRLGWRIIRLNQFNDSDNRVRSAYEHALQLSFQRPPTPVQHYTSVVLETALVRLYLKVLLLMVLLIAVWKFSSWFFEYNKCHRSAGITDFYCFVSVKVMTVVSEYQQEVNNAILTHIVTGLGILVYKLSKLIDRYF